MPDLTALTSFGWLVFKATLIVAGALLITVVLLLVLFTLTVRMLVDRRRQRAATHAMMSRTDQHQEER